MGEEERGRLTVITGPMFAGKSEELRRLINRHTYAKEDIVVFKSIIDIRYSESEVVTHDGSKLPAINVPMDESCQDIILNNSRNVRVVGYDEAQFGMAGVLPELLRDLAEKEKKIVYATLLNMDFLGRSFKSAENLLGYANEIKLLTAVCEKCGKDAIYTQRIDAEGKAVFHGDTIKVGAKKEYSARCSNCFERLNDLSTSLLRGKEVVGALETSNLAQRAKTKC